MEPGFLFLDDALGGIRWDAKYATWDNFTGRPVAGYEVNRIVVSEAMAEALRVVKARAASLGFGILVWDGYRPQRAVDCFAAWSALPEDSATKAAYYPNIDRSEMFERGYLAAKSGHSRGAAVDLTLHHLDTGALAPMGSGFDFMDELSHHGARGVTAVEADNRRTLSGLMEGAGFEPYQREWWHYALRREPYPNRYFDFPVA